MKWKPKMTRTISGPRFSVGGTSPTKFDGINYLCPMTLRGVPISPTLMRRLCILLRKDHNSFPSLLIIIEEVSASRSNCRFKVGQSGLILAEVNNLGEYIVQRTLMEDIVTLTGQH